MKQIQEEGNIIFYGVGTDCFSIEVVPAEGEVWITKERLAALFETSIIQIDNAISKLQNSRELSFRKTSYSLPEVIQIAWHLKGRVAEQVRKYDSNILQSYLLKGFVIDDNRIKEIGGTIYFDELKEYLKDLSSSQEFFYLKLLHLFSTSKDFNLLDSQWKTLVLDIRKILCYMVTYQLPYELVFDRMKCFNMYEFSFTIPSQVEVLECKNYMREEELQQFNNVVQKYLEIAYRYAEKHQVLYMQDWKKMIDEYFHLIRDVEHGILLSEDSRKVLDENLNSYYEKKVKDQYHQKKENDLMASIEILENSLKLENIRKKAHKR